MERNTVVDSVMFVVRVCGIVSACIGVWGAIVPMFRIGFVEDAKMFALSHLLLGATGGYMVMLSPSASAQSGGHYFNLMLLNATIILIATRSIAQKSYVMFYANSISNEAYLDMAWYIFMLGIASTSKVFEWK
jgi:hypothetical protein